MPETDDRTATDEPAPRDASQADAAPRTAWHQRRLARAAAVVLAVVVAFFAVTGVTGLPAPGALKRYPYGELSALSDRVNEAAGEYRTADDCWRDLRNSAGPLRSIAAVDYVRSRVVVRAYASESGNIDPDTFEAVTNAIDEVVRSDGRFSWAMVQIEPSPDGWSPLVSCRLVTRGWISGY